MLDSEVGWMYLKLNKKLDEVVNSWILMDLGDMNKWKFLARVLLNYNQ